MAFNYDSFVSDPLLHMGLGLLGSKGSFNNALSTGLLGGMQSYNVMQQVMEKKKAQEQARIQQEARQKWLEQQMRMNPQNAQTYQAMGMGFSPEQVKLMNPQPEMTALQNNLAAAGLTPGTPQYQQAIMQATTKPLVTMPGQEHWKKQRAEGLSKWADSFDANAQSNRRIMDALSRLDSLTSNVDTGMLKSFNTDLARLANEFGVSVDINGIASAEDFKSASNELVLELQKQQKGPQTDGDRAFMATTMPSIGKSPEANRKLVNYNMSRIMLDNIYASKAGGVGSINELNEAMAAKNKIQSEYRKVPAGAVIDGKAVNFKEFHDFAKRKGVDDETILQEWISATVK